MAFDYCIRLSNCFDEIRLRSMISNHRIEFFEIAQCLEHDAIHFDSTSSSFCSFDFSSYITDCGIAVNEKLPSHYQPLGQTEKLSCLIVNDRSKLHDSW